MQVVSAGAQTKTRVVNPWYTSGVSHAQQQLLTRHLPPHIILRYAADFYPVCVSTVHCGRQTPTTLPNKILAADDSNRSLNRSDAAA